MKVKYTDMFSNKSIEKSLDEILEYENMPY